VDVCGALELGGHPGSDVSLLSGAIDEPDIDPLRWLPSGTGVGYGARRDRQVRLSGEAIVGEILDASIDEAIIGAIEVV
jgi:hypothetical protein